MSKCEQIPTALLGYWLFESEISRQMGEFMFVSMTGGFMYSFAKLQVIIALWWWCVCIM